MDYKEIIESSYNRDNWINLLFDVFGNNVEFSANPVKLNVQDKKSAKEVTILGVLQFI